MESIVIPSNFSILQVYFHTDVPPTPASTDYTTVGPVSSTVGTMPGGDAANSSYVSAGYSAGMINPPTQAAPKIAAEAAFPAPLETHPLDVSKTSTLLYAMC